MTYTDVPGSHLNCRLWKTNSVTRMWTTVWMMLGSDHCGVCAPKEKLELSKRSLLFGPSAALTSTFKRFKSEVLCRNEWDIFLTLKKRAHNVMGTLWYTVRGTIDRLLLEKPGCVENDTLYSLLPYYLTFSTLHSSAKGWQSQQLPPWVRTSPFKEHLALRTVATKQHWNVVLCVQHL